MNSYEEAQDWSSVDADGLADGLKRKFDINVDVVTLSRNHSVEKLGGELVDVDTSEWITATKRTARGDLDPAWKEGLKLIDQPLTLKEQHKIRSCPAFQPTSYYNYEVNATQRMATFLEDSDESELEDSDGAAEQGEGSNSD